MLKRLRTLACLFALCAPFPALLAAAPAPNTLTSQEKAAGWRLLFDGQTLRGWRNYQQKEPGPEWQATNGAIVLQRSTRPGDAGKLRAGLITQEQFGDFALALEWRITPGANSGIFYRVSESGAEPHHTGIEMQVLDNQRHPDAKHGPEWQTGACYALYAPAMDATRPVREWNLSRILVRTNHVEHWLNGQKLLSYELGSEDWKQRVEQSKFKDFPGYGRSSRGHILLQDHNFHVEFRNIKIHPLESDHSDPLPSWNDGPAKQTILTFVNNVVREGSPSYVPPAERFAAFDNDGTLWAEQPGYTQAYFAMERAHALAAQHPEWNEPLKSAVAGDLSALLASGVQGLNSIAAAVGAGLTTEEYHHQVSDWLATARHPRFHCAYTDCAYQPMLELLRWFQANQFKTYIVSGGDLEFMRPWAKKLYGVPPEQVIGSVVVMKFELRDGKAVLVRQPQLQIVNDGVNKAVSIERVIGHRPIAAFGNSDGDIPMLEWTATGSGAHLCLFVHHTDAEREWAYDRNSAVGRLDKGLDEARDKGWTVVDMKKDWNRVFPFEAKQLK